MPVAAFCFLIWFEYLCSLLLNSVNSLSLPKSLEHLVVNDRKPRNCTQALSTFHSFLPHQTFVLTVSCVLLQYSDHYLFSLYPDFTHLLFLGLFVILVPLTFMLCPLRCVDCFIYFKVLPAKCSGKPSGALK